MRKRILTDTRRCQFARCKRPAVKKALYVSDQLDHMHDPSEDKPKRYCLRHALWYSKKNPHLKLTTYSERRRWQ